MFKLFSRAAVLGILLAITIPAQADDLQDANKLFKQGLHAQAMEKVNAFLDAQGFKQTRLRRKMMDLAAARRGAENVTTPHELAEIMALVHEGRALSAASKADLLRLLETPKAGCLTRLLPEELPVASKPGSLGGVRNEVGLVLLKGRPFVIAVMASHLRDERQGEAAIARIAQRVTELLDLAAASSPEGRILDPLQAR